jgi:hypothetical protein
MIILKRNAFGAVYGNKKSREAKTGIAAQKNNNTLIVFKI